MSFFTRPRIRNANYDKVLYYVDKMLSESDRYCRCHRCRLDASALALNTLPPHYYVDSGREDDKSLGSSWILIEIAVREALERVNSAPHHERPDIAGHDGPEAPPYVVVDTGTEG
ncbi:MAG: late competence development ComFB family protein [Nitrospirae bacterium]|nr:late competence development ComFB family protein [Nitrospirota bacterium]MBI5696492.1 late competence development ComFB family protein [Nitrospirota bacterium]